MDASQVADVLGTLATGGALALVALLVLRVAAPARFRGLAADFAGAGTIAGAAVAVVATAGSLWFSEGAHFTPCELCWYQRIAMYPLVVLLGVAAARGDRSVRPYALLLAGLGLAVSAYHNVIETFPDAGGGGCDPNNPCTLRWVEGLGFWTIPRMAFVAFALVLAALLLDRTPRPEEP